MFTFATTTCCFTRSEGYMTRLIVRCMQWIMLLGFLQASGQTAQLTIARNGYVSGEHAVFSFDGRRLAVRYGSDRSGLGFATDWYTFANGAWRSVPTRSHSRALPTVHLGGCDPDDAIDISNRFSEYMHSLAPGLKLKYVGAMAGQEDSAVAIYSRPAPNTQTGRILQISLLRDGAPVVIASTDIGESRYCSAQWNEHNDGTRDLIVFTVEPAGSSVSYAFQSFAIK